MRKKIVLPLVLTVVLAAGCAETRQETVPQAPDEPVFSADAALLEQAEATLAGAPSLPDLQAAPLDVAAETLYEALTGEAVTDELTRQVDETPAPSTTVCLYRGEAPWYDPYFLLETVETPADPRTTVYYYEQQYQYLYTVFDPASDAASLGDTALPFCTPDDAAQKLKSKLEGCGVELTAQQCRSLTAQALQSLWDARSAAGTLRESRWGTGDGPTKDHTFTSEHEQWTDADACYYLTAQQTVQGVPVEGTELSAYVGQEGLRNVSFSFAELTQTGEPAPLADYPALFRALNEAVQGIYAPEGCTLTGLALCYSPAGDGTYAPQWLATFTYPYTDPDGNAEQRETEVRLDARTCREIPMEAAE